MMWDDIKVCPCCGNKAKLTESRRMFFVHCPGCGISTSTQNEPRGCITKWNMRIPTAPVEDVDGLVPLVLYFGSREDADGFIADVQEAKPGMIKKHV